MKISNSSIFMALMSALLMGLYGVFYQVASVSSELLAFSRLSIGAIATIFYFSILDRNFSFIKKPRIGSILSGVFLSLFIVLYIKAIPYISLSNAVSMIYLAPLISIILSFFLFKERVGFFDFIFMSMAFIGVFIMYFDFKNWLFDINPGFFMGLSSAVFYSLFIISNKNKKEANEQCSHIVHQLFFGAMLLIPFLSGGNESDFTSKDIIALILAGILSGGAATLLSVKALSNLNVSTYGVIIYFEPIAVVFYSWIFFQDFPDYKEIFGMTIIFLSGVLKILYDGKEIKKTELV